MHEYTQKINGNGHRPEADASEVADAIRSKPNEAHATPRPDSIDEFYAETQTEEGVKEQEEAYKGNAQKEAAAPERTEAALSYQAEKAKKAGDRQDALADGEHKRFEADLSVLRQHRRRGPHAAVVYWLVRVLILLGDVGGISGAMLLLGEEPFNAFAQATSVAVSAVVLGVVGTEVRHWAAAKARQKPPEELTKPEKACFSFFNGPDPSAAIKILALIFVAGVVAIVVGILTLREAAEGQGVALAFGCFAFAVCLASFLNSYAYACEVSDYLETANSCRKKFGTEAAKATANPVIAEHDGAEAEVKSIQARNKAEGVAAGHGLRREMYGEFREHPETYGHGTASGKEGKNGGQDRGAKGGS